MRRKVDRREALAAFGTVSLGGLLAACGGGAKTAPPSASESEAFDSSATCTVTPELTEGPYYFDVEQGDGVLGVMTFDVRRS